MSQKLISLGELCREIYRYPTYYDIKYVEGGVPEIRGTLINEDGTLDMDERKWRFISAETSSRFHRTILAEGDLVISVRGTIGKIGLVPPKLVGANITANLIRVSPDKGKVHERYLWRFMQSPQFITALDGISSSTTIKTIKAPDLKALKIPIFSIAEQKRIAAVLDKAEELRDLRRKVLGELDAIVQSIFLEMFGNPETNPKHLTDKIRPFVKASSGKSSKKVLSVEQTGIPIYGGNGINGWATQSLYDDPVLVVGRVGQQCGKTYITDRPVWITDNAIAVEIVSEQHLNLTYLLHSFSMTHFSDRVKYLDLPFINQQMILDFPIPIPPIDLQQEFARRVEAIEQLKFIHRASLAQLDALFASLQHRAFQGEL